MVAEDAAQGTKPALQPPENLAYGENPALSYTNMRAIIGYIGTDFDCHSGQRSRPNVTVVAWLIFNKGDMVG